jgi:hypothetical protein
MCKSEREKENKEITFEHLQGVHTEIGNSARELAHRCREGDTVKSQIWADRFSLAQARHCYASVRLAYEIASRRDSSVADESWSMAWKAASDAYFNYGNFLADSKLLKTARIYFELAHASARKACDSTREGRARHGLGDVLMHQCRFAEASNQYLRDAALLARLKNPPIYDRKATLSNCVRALLRTFILFSLTCSLSLSLTHLSTHSHSLTHSLTHSQTHIQVPTKKEDWNEQLDARKNCNA